MADEAIVSVYLMFPDAAEAERIGLAMVEGRLAACVNILGEASSIYWWQGKVERARETAAIFKTTAAGADALMAGIAAAHSYDTPAITVWPVVAAHGGYGRWVKDEVR